MNLDLTSVKARWIVQESTDIDVVEATHLGAGNDFVSYLINGEWVFRFPKSWANADTLLNERKFLETLSIPTRTPRFKYWQTRPIGYPVPIAGYRVIQGDTLESLQPESCAVDVLSVELAEVLRELHQHSKCLVPSQANRTGLLLLQPSEDIWFGLDAITNEERNAAQSFLYQYRNEPGQTELELSFIHGDLGVEHIIADQESRLQGIIDWGNASQGNRFRDFIGLWGWGGDKFVVETLRHYDALPRASEWALIRAWGLIYCIGRYRRACLSESTVEVAILARLRRRIDEVAGTDLYAEP